MRVTDRRCKLVPRTLFSEVIRQIQYIMNTCRMERGRNIPWSTVEFTLVYRGKCYNCADRIGQSRLCWGMIVANDC